MRILMVENHAVFARTVVEQFLSAHRVDVVPTVEGARVALEGAAYDVILVDYDLDDGKGDAFVLAARAAGFRGAIVATSSHDDGNQALVLAGANDVCRKTKFHTIADVIARSRRDRSAARPTVHDHLASPEARDLVS